VQRRIQQQETSDQIQRDHWHACIDCSGERGSWNGQVVEFFQELERRIFEHIDKLLEIDHLSNRLIVNGESERPCNGVRKRIPCWYYWWRFNDSRSRLLLCHRSYVSVYVYVCVYVYVYVYVSVQLCRNCVFHVGVNCKINATVVWLIIVIIVIIIIIIIILITGAQSTMCLHITLCRIFIWLMVTLYRKTAVGWYKASI